MSMKPRSRRLANPALFVLFGAAGFAAHAINDRPGDGLLLLGVSLALAVAAALIPSRGDLTSIARAEADERQRTMDLRANWYAAQAMALAAVGGVLWQVSRDASTAPFAVVLLAGAVGYVGSLLVLRHRS